MQGRRLLQLCFALSSLVASEVIGPARGGPRRLDTGEPAVSRRPGGGGGGGGGATEGRARRRRAWVFPGTLWCGTGSKAAGYEQLGMFESADRCCREHDHCQHNIPAFTVNYGVFNPKFFTVSHCDCDQRFRRCLLGVNDSISSMVGYSFFSILQVPCFEFKQQRQCTEMHWWGMCKEAKRAPYAVFKSPLPYNTSDVTSKYGDNTGSNTLTSSERQNVTESCVIDPHRKSPKSEHRCKSRDPPRGDTYYHRRKKGRGCRRHRKLYKVATSQKPTNSYSQTTSLTQEPALQLHLPTAITAVAKSHRKVPKQSRCCGMLLKGDSFQPYYKRCLDQKTTSQMTNVPHSTTTYRSPITVTTLEMLQLKNTTETPKQDVMETLWSTVTSATPVTTKLKTAASIHKHGKPLEQVDSHLWNNTSQEPMGRTKASNTHAERDLTDKQLMCGSLKHLDGCKYKIPPLEKKYDLQNMEPKTAYHCDCTSRLAVQIERFKQPSILPKLLMDFVSQYCFQLPKEKKCHSRKSCSGGFTKASGLLRALKKMDEKDNAGVRNSGNERRRGIPVRLYKRCLRLEREADIMAQHTRL